MRTWCAVAVACAAAPPAFAGIGDDFGRQLLYVAGLTVAGYAAYLVAFVIAILLFRRGRRVLALALAAVTVSVGVLYPLVDTWRYNRMADAVRDSILLPESLNLSGRTILLVTNGSTGCSDLCLAVMRHQDPAALFHIRGPHDTTVGLDEVTRLTDLTRVRRVTLDSGGYRGVRTEFVGSEGLADVDYLIFDGLSVGLGQPFLPALDGAVPADRIMLSDLMAPVPDAQAFSLEDLQPDLRILYLRGKHRTVPLNLMVSDFQSIPPYRFRDREFAKLLCPEGLERLRNGCSDG